MDEIYCGHIWYMACSPCKGEVDEISLVWKTGVGMVAPKGSVTAISHESTLLFLCRSPSQGSVMEISSAAWVLFRYVASASGAIEM